MTHGTSLFATPSTVKHTTNAQKASVPASTDSIFDPAKCATAFHAISNWQGYEPTALRQLDGLAARLSVGAIYYKDESGRFGIGSFKSLGGAYAVSVILLKLVEKTLNRPVTVDELMSGEHSDITRTVTVSCATDGNHGRSVAWGAKRFGCRCVIYIHRDVSIGRKEAIEQYGADVVRVDGNYDDSIRKADSDAAEFNRIVVSDTSYPGYVDIPGDVMRGYTVLADEAISQMGTVKPTHVFLQGGVGGFAAAVIARIRHHEQSRLARTIVVEPENAACIYESTRRGELTAVHGDLETVMAGLACGEVSLLAFDTLQQELDDVLVIQDSAAVTCMRQLADGIDNDEPLVAGESAVAGLAGLALSREDAALSDALGLDEHSVVLLIGTEGATDPDVYTQLVGKTPQAVVAQ